MKRAISLDMGYTGVEEDDHTMTTRLRSLAIWALGNAIVMAPFLAFSPTYSLTAILGGTGILVAMWCSPNLARGIDALCKRLGGVLVLPWLLLAALVPHAGGIAVALLLAYACRQDFTSGKGPALRLRASLDRLRSVLAAEYRLAAPKPAFA